MSVRTFEDEKRSARKRILLGRRFMTFFMTMILLLFSFLFLMPVIFTFTNSFMSASEISANYGAVFATTQTGGKVFVSRTVNLKFIPDMVTGAQYMTVLLRSPSYLLKFWNSVIYVVPIVVLQLFVALLAAYGFSRERSFVKEVIFFIYIILMLMPYQVTLVPNFLVSQTLHIVNTRWAIWLPGIFSPFAVFLLTKFMRRIPLGVLEAAKIDGAGEWQIFSQIAMPLCKGAIASVAILIFIDYWNMVEQPLVLLDDEDMHPLSFYPRSIPARSHSLLLWR